MSTRSPEYGSSRPRRFAGYLLTSSLGRDALGESFRGLTLAPGSREEDDPGRKVFVRLRLFDSPELPRERVAAAFAAAKDRPRPLSGPAVAEDERLDVDPVEGIPYLVWSESHAWALDRVMEAAGPAGIPVEPALLIVDRIAAALEHAARAGRTAGRHGLVWPGFVTIGDDGAVRLGGFGVAPAVLPCLGAPGLAKEIALYVAPELRSGGPRPDSADVYSVAAIALELLTGARPSRLRSTDPLPSVDADLRPPLPRGLADALETALAPEPDRTPTVSALRREIGQALVAEGLSPSSRELGAWVSALFPPPDESSEAVGQTVEIETPERDRFDEEWQLAVDRLEPVAVAVSERPRRGVPRARVPLPHVSSSRDARPRQ